MFEKIIISTNYRGPNAYEALRKLQSDIGSQAEINITRLENDPSHQIVATIEDLGAQTCDKFGNLKGDPRAIVGKGESAADALIKLRDEILSIGIRPSEQLVQGPNGLFHTKIIVVGRSGNLEVC